MKYLSLLFLPILTLFYALTMDKNAQGFQDIVAILMSFVGIVGGIFALLLDYLTKKKSWNGKWYVNMLFSAMGCVISFVILIIYSRMYN